MPKKHKMDIATYTLNKKIPFAVQINLTGRCNLACIHCCVSKGGDYHNELNFEEICNALDQLAKAGTLVLTLSGGEPTLREDFCAIVEYARKLDFAVTIFTNGTRLEEAMVKRLGKLNVHEVHVSLYAMDATIHDEITGVQGSWKCTVSSIERLCGEGVGIKIKCPIMRHNVGHYRGVYDFAMKIGAAYAFDPVITARDDGNRDALDLRISCEELRQVFQDTIFQNRDEFEGTENSSCLMSSLYNEIPCSAGHNICFISPEGNVAPCVQLPIVCGNLKQSGFEWIWKKSPEITRLRALRIRDIQECADCHYLSWCARCPGLAYLEDGNLLGPSTAACWMAETKGGEIAKI